MDPVTLIVTALAAGAGAAAKDTASVVKDAYYGLRALVKKRLAGRPEAELVLARYQEAPQTWQAPLAAELHAAGAARDAELLGAARALMTLVDEAGATAGKYTVDMRGAQGVQAGDRNTQLNEYVSPEKMASWVAAQIGETRPDRFRIMGDSRGGGSSDFAIDGPMRPEEGSRSKATVMPVTIYLSDERNHRQVEAAVEDLLAVIGMQVQVRDDPIVGSWFRRMWATLKEGMRSPAAQEAALVAAHVADTRLVLAQDAAVTATLLQNLGPVITALQPTKDAVVRVGALLIVKVDWIVHVFQLTAAQQAQLDHRPQLAASPREIIAALNLTPGNQDEASPELR